MKQAATSPIGIIIIDDQAIINAVDAAASAMFGYTEAALNHQRLSLLWTEAERKGFDTDLAPGLRPGQTITREVNGRRSDSTLFPARISINGVACAGLYLWVVSVTDLSAQKTVEAGLAKSLATTRAILDTAVNPIITIDAAGRIRSFNPAAVTLFGFAAEEVIGQNVKLLMPEPYRGEHDGYLSRYLHEGQPRIIGQGREVIARRKDGSEFPIHLSVGEMQVSGERMFVGIIADISKLRAAEKSSAESNELTRAILDTAVNPIITIDGGGKIRSFNPAAEKFFDYSAEEVTGRNVSLLMPAPYRTEHDGYLARYLREGDPRIIGAGREVTAMRKDGTLVPIHLSVGEMSLSGQRMFVGIMLDMSERKSAETELRQHRDHLEEMVANATAEVGTIIRTAQSGIVTFDDDGRIRLFNPTAETLFGWSRGEALDQHISVLIEGLDDDGNFVEIVRKAEEGSAIGRGREVSAHRRDGTSFPALLTLGRAILNDGHAFFVAFVSDITVQKQNEDALKKAKEAAEAGARAKSQFLANMSHEIRTPMSAIIGFAEIALQDAMLVTETRHHLDIILASARSLLVIINDVLDISKLDSGKFSLENITFHLDTTVRAAISTIEHKAAEQGLTIRVEIAPDLKPHRIGDPTRLRQILLNLIGNAIKFTEKGGITVSIIGGDDPDVLQFAIADTGIGMNEAQRAHVFELFAQADDSMTRRFGGTGLGTTISKEIVELMGGRIWLESQPGQGSTFTFSVPLPIAADIPASSGDHAAPSGGYISPRLFHILLCEDIETNATLAILRLRQAGHDILRVSNGYEAVAAYGRQSFDLILMDLMMPDMDGLEATRRIRVLEKEHRRYTPILALTASVMPEDYARCKAAGMDGIEAKPIEFDRLLATMEAVVPPDNGRANPGVAVQAAPADDDGAFDLEPLAPYADLLRAKRTWGTPHTYLRSMRIFTEQFAARGDELVQAIASGRREDATRLAHGLKGVAGNLALDEIYRLASDIDTALREGKDGDTAEECEQLQAALRAVTTAVLACDPATSPASAPPRRQRDATQEKAALAQMRAALEALNPDTVQPLLDAAAGWLDAAELAALRREVERYDFAAAVRRVDRLDQHEQDGEPPS